MPDQQLPTDALGAPQAILARQLLDQRHHLRGHASDAPRQLTHRAPPSVGRRGFSLRSTSSALRPSWPSVVWSANAEIAPLAQGGRVAGIQNCVGNAGGLAAPIVAGFLQQATHSWAAPMIAAAIVALGGAAIYTIVLSDKVGLRQSMVMKEAI